ncbi:MAG: hypothetical protein LBE35_06955 [Clostridiales bacterium]|jgi:hypothetical protein|nr:hypothetical protein [Clostridiales bacterium]
MRFLIAAAMAVLIGMTCYGEYGEVCESPTNQGLVYFSQRDPRWADVMFGSFTMAQGGCGPTAIAMVASTLGGREILPCYVANWGGRFYIAGIGSSHAIFTSQSTHDHFGLNYRAIPINNDAEIAEALRSGAMIITSVQSQNSPAAHSGNQGIFTINPDGMGGHIVVIYGITDCGNVLVASSLREDLAKNVEGWPLSTLRREMHSGVGVFWVFRHSRESGNPPPLLGGFRVKRRMTEVPANLSAKRKPKSDARKTSFPQKRESPTNGRGFRVKRGMTAYVKPGMTTTFKIQNSKFKISSTASAVDEYYFP